MGWGSLTQGEEAYSGFVARKLLLHGGCDVAGAVVMTYMKPMAKMQPIPTLRFVCICSFQSIGIGSRTMMKSASKLKTAVYSSKLVRLPQWPPGIVLSKL